MTEPEQPPKRSTRLLVISLVMILLGVALYIIGVKIELGGSDGAMVGLPGMAFTGVGLLTLVYALFVYLRRAR